VREFIELVADRVGAILEVREGIEGISDGGYDYLFVDDRGELLDMSLPLLEQLAQAQHIVLYNEPKEKHAHFDMQIKKPFLPSDIQEILEHTPSPKVHLEEDQILNIQDIEEIKSLLEDEGMEIVSEEDLIDEIDVESGMQVVESERCANAEEKLLEAIMQMEPKKIRKLLKGAEVNIQIRFPKESE
jgi:hypothetical protein